MPLDSRKELAAVRYSAYSVQVIHRFTFSPSAMTFRLHWHDRLELLRVHSGSLMLNCTNHHSVLQAGDVALISPRLLHSGTAGENGVVYDVIAFNLANLLNETDPVRQYVTPLLEGKCVFEPLVQNSAIRDRLDSIVSAHREEPVAHPLQVVGELYDLLGLLYKNCVIRDVVALPSQKHFDQAISYINDHYAEDISSATLSQRFGYNESYFCRKFKEQTGLTVMKYILILRIEEARRLLLETAHSVQDIASMCGFSDTAYFANRFKRICRVTPTQLREHATDKAKI